MKNRIHSRKTAVFCLYNLSKRKRSILYDSMERQHRGFHDMMHILLNEFENIEEIPSRNKRKDYIQKRVYEETTGWPLAGSAKACIREDAKALIESFIQQRCERPRAGAPTIPRLDVTHLDYAGAMDDLACLANDEDEENRLRDVTATLSRIPAPRPLALYGYGHFYRLLRHPRTGRLYAWVNIRPESARYTPSRAEMTRQASANDDMVDVASGRAIACRSPTWMLVPLAFGFDFHVRRFLAVGKPGHARLVYQPEADRFELHVTFDYEAPARTPQLYLGVDRGIYNLAGYAVTDAEGRVYDRGVVSGRSLRHVQRAEMARRRHLQRRGRMPGGRNQRAWADEAVHVTANAIVDLADQYDAKVVMENLPTRRVGGRTKGRGRGRGPKTLLNRQQYAKLYNVISYKLPGVGLPPPEFVKPEGTSITCPECGCRDKENREKRPASDGFHTEQFLCISCGFSDHADINAGRVVAMKKAWLETLPTKKARNYRRLTEAELFETYIVNAALRRCGSSGVYEASVPS